MTLLVLTGSKGSKKELVMDLILKRRKSFPKFKYIKMDDLIKKRKLNSIDEVKELLSCLYPELKKKAYKPLDHAKKPYKNIILDGMLAIKTDDGFVPILTSGFFEIFKPDILVVFEADLDDSVFMAKKGIDVNKLREEQEFIKNYSIACSQSGTMVKIIKVKHDNIKYAIDNISKLFKITMDV